MNRILQSLTWLAFLLAIASAGCGDDAPSLKEQCAASCESRGGEFYLMQGEYCYCAWYGDGGTD